MINCPHNGCLVEVRADQVETSAGNGAVSHFAVPVKLPDDARDASEQQLGETIVDVARQSEPGSSAGRAKGGPWLRRNVARFIPGGGSGAGAALASDGRLPELKLQEGQKRRASSEAEATNPLVMVGVLCLSFVMSTALVLYDSGTPGGNDQQVKDRRRLAEFCEQSTGTLAPYQQYLRDAQRAHSRGDEQTERQMYRRVLQLLRAEGRSRYTTVTPTRLEDRELEELLARLMPDE